MKKVICLFLSLLLLCSAALAEKQFDQVWAKGTYTIDLSRTEREEAAALYARMSQQRTALGLEALDTYTPAMLQWQYKTYMESDAAKNQVVTFEDTGRYTYSAGLPQEGDIDTDAAFALARRLLQETYQLTDDQLASYYPEFSYMTTTSDPQGNFYWLHFICMDKSSRYHYSVKIFADDGSIGGIARSSSNG